VPWPTSHWHKFFCYIIKGATMAAQDRDITPQQPQKDIPKTPATGEPVSGHIENAHAAGVGAMGRNDEKLPTGEDGTYTPGPDEPAY
jgi:hypothetical protein